MMQANELRIGNWISYWIDEKAGVLVKVTGILENKIMFEDDNGSVPRSIDRFKPIPLTAKLLEAVGFKRTIYEEQDAYRLDLHVSLGYWLSALYFPKSEAAGVMLFNNASPVGEMLYEYLYQVQNFYFDLTGNELEIGPVLSL